MDPLFDAAKRFASAEEVVAIEGEPTLSCDATGLIGRSVDVTAVDGGLALLARRSNAALGVVKIAMVLARHPGIEAVTQRWVVLVHAEEEYVVTMTSLETGEVRKASLMRMDASGIEREPERGLDLARALLERDAQSRASGFVLADGSLSAKMPEEREACARIPAEVLGIVKRSSRSSRVSAESIVEASFSGVFAHRIDGAYYARLHPLGSIIRIEGSLDEERFGMLVSASCDAAIPGYPYALVLADRFARISNREARALALEAASRFGIPIGSLHDVLDSLEY